MRDDLVAQLNALGEDDFYYSPATTKAKINEAKTALKSQSARIKKLETALRNLDDMIVDLDAGNAELHQVSRFIAAALAGGKDE